MHAEDVGVVQVVVLAVFSSLVDCRAALPPGSGDAGEWISTMWPLYRDPGRRPVRWAREMAVAGLSMERVRPSRGG
jgi:hypothetical protein